MIRKDKNRQTNQTQDLVFTALFAVLIAICSWISIPTAIPFTMQTFAVFLTLNFLGTKRGILSICIYLLLGLIGLPVFANFTSGIGMILGTTGGYMIGWILSGCVMWITEKILGRKLWAQITAMLLGLITCYIIGTLWFMFVYARSSGSIGLCTALLWCVVPFVVPDLAKILLAFGISKRLEKVFNRFYS